MTKITDVTDKKELDYGYEKLIETRNRKLTECNKILRKTKVLIRQLQEKGKDISEVVKDVKRLEDKLKTTSEPLLSSIRKGCQSIYITCFTTIDNSYVKKAITKHWKNKADISIIFKEDFYKVLQEIEKSCWTGSKIEKSCWTGSTCNIRTLRFWQVIYTDNSEKIGAINENECPLNYIPFIKRPKYKCEQEWRLLVNVISREMRETLREALLNTTFGKGVKIRVGENPNEKCYFYFPVKEYVDQIRVLHNIDSNSLKLLEELGIKVVQSN